VATGVAGTGAGVLIAGAGAGAGALGRVTGPFAAVIGPLADVVVVVFVTVTSTMYAMLLTMTWPHCKAPVAAPSVGTGFVATGVVGTPTPGSGIVPAKAAGGMPGIAGRLTVVPGDGAGKPYWARH
jgi:hypothetical protein